MAMKKFGTSLARLDWDVNAPSIWEALHHGKGEDEITQVGTTDSKSELGRFYDGNAKSWAKDIHPNGTESSSWVSVIDYDNKSLELKITFRDGTTCLYKDISPDMAESFSKADSKGRWVHNNLVVNHHDYTIVAAGAKAQDIDLYHRGGLLGKNNTGTEQPQSNAMKPATRVKNATGRKTKNSDVSDIFDLLDNIFEGFKILK